MESKQGAKGAKSAGKRQSEDARFEEYTAELFCKEVSANTSFIILSLMSLIAFPDLYQFRWGVESKYRELKNRLEIEAFNSIKPASIQQAISKIRSKDQLLSLPHRHERILS